MKVSQIAIGRLKFQERNDHQRETYETVGGVMFACDVMCEHKEGKKIDGVGGQRGEAMDGG